MDIVPLSPEAFGDTPAAGEPFEPETFASTFPYTRAMLLARIYEALPLVCPRCGSSMRIIAFITASAEVKRILEHIGEPSEPPPVSPSRAPPQVEFDLDGDTEFEFNQDLPEQDGFECDQGTGEAGDTLE